MHILNYDQVPDGKPLWQKVAWIIVEGRRLLALKSLHRLGDRAIVGFVSVDPSVPRLVAGASELLLCTVWSAIEELVEERRPRKVTLFLDYLFESGLQIPPRGITPLPAGQDLIVVLEK
ncbi:MAG: hypothetical protein NZ899_13530 [Thermoguttaceae bacterium]|nr:hypothetical protein [Thermoguttaceae bacterium]MDW8077268.1 hypothetical protein [Thermoguttaceae bacterium]